MKFRRLRNILTVAVLACTSFTFQSCDSWLDVTPEAQVNDKTMFSTQQGFMDVLNGIYITASKEKLYGKNLLFSMTDVMAQYYKIPDDKHEFSQLSQYKYKDLAVSPKLDQIWLEMYFCIANCNILLENLEKVGPEFFEEPRTYYILRAEAKALRAFFHFDLLRLFAPSYKADPDYAAIPYVTKYSNEVTPQSSVSAVIDSVLVDLNAAAEDLKENDPILDPLYKGSDDMYMWTQPMPDRNEFLSYRGFRLNYYAVNGMLARVYAYKLDKQKAYDHARIVIDSEVFKFTKAWEVTTSPEFRNRILRPEIIFGFNVPKMTKIFEPYSLNSSMGNKWLTIQNSRNIFQDDVDDYRSKYLMEYEILADRPSCLKFVKPENPNDMVEGKFGIIAPMMRISEMYYYVCEYLMDTDLEAAASELQKLRDARNVKNTLHVNSAEDMQDIIVNDARREFMCEGQMFFFYKRLDRKVINESSKYEMTDKDFVWPLPNVELEFGERLSNLYK